MTTALRPADRVADAVGIGDVRPDEAVLADLGERLDEIAARGIARRDPDPGARLQQQFADVAADKSVAAKDGDELFFAIDHGLAH